MRLSVGCAQWTHAAWRGRYLPHPLPPGERLRAYASWCTAVEGNTTFYATPPRETAESWAGQTGADFRFVPKLPKPVTHEHRLTGGDAEMRAFLHAIEPLGARVHTLWIQLPGSFGPGDLGALAAFLHRLPGAYRYAVEVRHPEFFARPAALERVLARVGAEWLTFDTETLFATRPGTDAEREAWMKKPRLPRRTTALTDRPIVRYIGRDDPERTAEGWRHWVETVAGWLREGRSPTVFVHTPDNADAPTLARRFHDDVRAEVPGAEPLPEPMSPKAPDEPLTLF